MSNIRILQAGLPAEIAALVCGKVDLGAGANGVCRILSGAGVTLVDIDLADPAFVANVDGVQVAQLPLQGTAVAVGTAAKCQILDCDGEPVFEGDAVIFGASGFAQLDRVQVDIGDVVTIQGMTLTGP